MNWNWVIDERDGSGKGNECNVVGVRKRIKLMKWIHTLKSDGYEQDTWFNWMWNPYIVRLREKKLYRFVAFLFEKIVVPIDVKWWYDPTWSFGVRKVHLICCKQESVADQSNNEHPNAKLSRSFSHWDQLNSNKRVWSVRLTTKMMCPRVTHSSRCAVRVLLPDGVCTDCRITATKQTTAATRNG